MATEIVRPLRLTSTPVAGHLPEPLSACGYLHDNLRNLDEDSPPAAIFNEAAEPTDLISYAHGQLNTLRRLLQLVVDKPGGGASPIDEVSLTLIAPAMEALELAADLIHERRSAAA